MNEIKIHEYESAHELDMALSKYVAKQLKSSIEKKGKASLIVSGGSTPKNMLSLLSTKELDWQKVFITLADERWVASDCNDSNEKMIRDVLLQNKAKKAQFRGLKVEGKNPHFLERKSSEQLDDFPFPATVCLLGMGEDGHIASIFPHAKELADIIYENELLTKACTPRKAAFARMTLTPDVIGSSDYLLLHIVGEKKRKTLQEAINGGDIFDMPIRLFLANPRLEVFVS